MTKLEKLCLPGCGYDLSILNPFVVPGYDDFQPMISDSVLEKVNDHGTKAIGERLYTQLGISQNQILENERKDEEERLTAETVKDVEDELDEDLLAKQMEHSYDINNSGDNQNELVNIEGYIELLKGSPDDLIINEDDQNSNKQPYMMAEIKSLSKDLMLTSELFGKEIKAPCYMPIAPIFQKSKKEKTKGDKNAEKGKKGKKSKKKIAKKKEEDAEKESKSEERIEQEDIENEKETDEKDQCDGESEKEVKSKTDDEVKTTKDENDLDDESLKASSSVTSLSEFLRNKPGDWKKTEEPQKLEELKIDDVEQLLNTIDLRNDILSQTFLTPPERRKIKKAEDESINKGGRDNIDDIAAACLPDAYDLWKEKYKSLVEEEYPDAGKREIENQLRKLWCQIPDEHRHRYYNKAEKLFRRYSATATFSYMHRLKCGGSKYSKQGGNFKEKPIVVTPKAIRAKRPEADLRMSEREDEEEEEEEEGHETGNSSTSYDFTKAMKETTTFNSPSDNDLKKKLADSRVLDESDFDFTDENAIATGILLDIMMGEKNENVDVDEGTVLSQMWEHEGTMDLPRTGSLDISGLDEYLLGKGDGYFIEEKTKKKRARKKKNKKNDEKGTIKEKQN